jgi:hypothetical protein
MGSTFRRGLESKVVIGFKQAIITKRSLAE